MNNIDEVKAAADRLGIKYHPNISEDTLRMRINQQPVAEVAAATAAVMAHPAAIPPVVTVVYHDESTVRAAIAAFIDKGVIVSFNHDEHTVHMSYKGREECINLSVPLRVIRMKAESVSKGRVAVKGFKDGADTVLWA